MFATLLFYTPAVRPLPRRLSRSLEQQGRGLGLLVVRLGAFGDVLRTVPAMRLLRRALPEARLAWMIEDRWRIALEGHPDLDRLIVVPRAEWEPLVRTGRFHRLVGRLRAFGRHARQTPIDCSIDFHGNFRSGLLTRLCAAPVRIGFAGHQQKEGNFLFSTHRIPSGDLRTPRMERNLDPIRLLGLPLEPLPGAALPMVDAGAAAAEQVVAGLDEAREGFALISPGASLKQIYKKPPADLLVAACERLSARRLVPLVVYGPGEEDDARAVAGRVPAAALAPPTDLPALSALLHRARVFVGGDSGPLHLACATGCPVVGIYGPTDPRVNRPWGVPYTVVHPPGRRYTGIKRIDRNSGGFDGLTATHVVEAIDAILDR